MAQPLPAELEKQAARNAAVRALAAQQLTSLWPRVDWSSDLATQAVTALYRAVVRQFGSTAATLAADFYDDLREGQGVRTRYRATVAEPVNEDQVKRIVESAFLGTREPLDVHQRRRVSRVTTSELPVDQRVPARLDASLSRLVMQPARATIARNVAADPAKPTWIRVPTGETTCEFCIMLASRELGRHFRGYTSRDRALFDDNGEKFHTGCDCEAVSVFPGVDAHTLSPRMRDYQQIYQKGAANAGTRADTKRVLAEMRKAIKADAGGDEPSTETSSRRRTGKASTPRPAAAESKADIAARHLPLLEQNLANLRATGHGDDSEPVKYHEKQIAKLRGDLTPAASPPRTPPPAPPRRPATGGGDDDEQPEGWSGHVKGYQHPHRSPVWTEGERVERQAALGHAVPDGEQLHQHEIEVTEALHAMGETIQWIARGEPDQRGGRRPTNDFTWVTNGGIEVELKSTSAKYRSIRERISDTVMKAATQGVTKENFVIDIGQKTLKTVLQKQLSDYNAAGDTDRRIAGLWVLTRGELVRIELK